MSLNATNYEKSSYEQISEQISKQIATLAPERLQAVQGLVSGWLSTTQADSLPVSSDVAQAVVNDEWR